MKMLTFLDGILSSFVKHLITQGGDLSQMEPTGIKDTDVQRVRVKIPNYSLITPKNTYFF